MSLAARICSMVAVEKNPGMVVKIRNPKAEIRYQNSCALALAETRCFGFRASSRRAVAPSQRVGFRPSVFGFLLRHLKFLLLELPILRLRWLDQQETQILLDPRPQQGALEYGGLDRVERGKEVAAINIVLEI